MVNTPLVPMFGSKGGDDGGSFGGLSSPGLDGATAKLGSWAGGATEQAGIVLDDVRKFRRSARISGSSATGFGGGALGGMYDDQPAPASTNGQQPRRASPSHLNSMQQNAINLGLAGLQQQQQHQQQQQQRSGSASPGLSSQQAAVAAQQNWRNGLGSPAVDSGDQYSQHGMGGFGMGMSSPGNLSANAQLANLFALQQQMMQQQQMQQLNMAAAAVSLALFLVAREGELMRLRAGDRVDAGSDDGTAAAAAASDAQSWRSGIRDGHERDGRDGDGNGDGNGTRRCVFVVSLFLPRSR